MIGSESSTAVASTASRASAAEPCTAIKSSMSVGTAAAIGTVTFVAGAYYTDQRAMWFISGVLIITAIRMLSLVADIQDPGADIVADGSERVLRSVPGKLPQLGESLGKSIRGFKKAMSEKDDDKC